MPRQMIAAHQTKLTMDLSRAALAGRRLVGAAIAIGAPALELVR